MYKKGGIFSVLCSLCYLATGILVVLQPVIFQDANVDLFLNTMAENPMCFILYYLAIALSAFFGLGVVEQITNFLKVNDSELVKWTQRLAYIGFAVLAMSYFKVFTVKPYMSNFYMSATESEKEIILTMDAYISFAPNGIVTYGFMGIWILSVCILSLRRKNVSLICSITGIILGIILISVTAQNVGALATAILNTAKGSISFLWFGLIGINMIKSKDDIR